MNIGLVSISSVTKKLKTKASPSSQPPDQKAALSSFLRYCRS